MEPSGSWEGMTGDRDKGGGFSLAISLVDNWTFNDRGAEISLANDKAGNRTSSDRDRGSSLEDGQTSGGTGASQVAGHQVKQGPLVRRSGTPEKTGTRTDGGEPTWAPSEDRIFRTKSSQYIWPEIRWHSYKICPLIS